MTGYFINLTDGTRLEAKLNFGTIYHLQKCKGFYRITRKMRKAEKKGIPKEKALTEAESFDMAADIIYAILRSNGKQVTFDEALALVPPGAEEIESLLDAFQEEYDEYNKKNRRRDLRRRCSGSGLGGVHDGGEKNGNERRGILELRPILF